MDDKGSSAYNKVTKEINQDQAALDEVTKQLAFVGQAAIDGIVSGVRGQQVQLSQALVDAMATAKTVLEA